MRTRTALAFATLFLAISVTSWACDTNKAKHKKARANGGTLSMAAGVAPRADGGLVLHLDDLRVKAGEAGVFRVFANHPEANAQTPMTHANFVDELFIVPSQTSASGTGAGHNYTLPLPAAAIRAGDPVVVTLVPVENGKLNVTVKRAWVAAR